MAWLCPNSQAIAAPSGRVPDLLAALLRIRSTPTAIDSAFKRRLSFRLTFPFPDEEARESLWRSHLPPGVPRAGTFDLAALAQRYRLSGGYIRNAALRAAFIAAEEHSPLTQDHLERAIKAEFREIGKIGESGVLE